MLLGYIRVSTDDQAREGRSSLQTQTDVIEGLARARGLDKYDVQIYEDAGVSGAIELRQRPAGGKLLADMKAGDVVVTAKLDRMFRSTADALAMFEEFKKRGVDLIFYDMSHEPISSGVGKLLMTILAAVGEMERERIKERTEAGRKAKKAKGGPVGKVPLGFSKVGSGATASLVPCEREQAAKARVIELRTSRQMSYRSIRNQLANEGMLSRSGKPYSPEVVRQLVLAREAHGEAV